jgi:hypothetical protein
MHIRNGTNAIQKINNMRQTRALSGLAPVAIGMSSACPAVAGLPQPVEQ